MEALITLHRSQCRKFPLKNTSAMPAGYGEGPLGYCSRSSNFDRCSAGALSVWFNLDPHTMRSLRVLTLAMLLYVGNCMAQLGTLDVSFNPNDLGFGYGAGPDAVSKMIVQPDGMILLAGVTSYGGVPCNGIVRISSNDAALDPSFNAGSGANDAIWDVALQSDGKIIVAGDFSTFNGVSRNHIARLHPDGSLDVTFDPGPGPDASVGRILIQPDGKVLVHGYFSSFNGFAKDKFCRLNSDGSLDNAYNANWSNPNFIGLTGGLFLTSDSQLYIGCGGPGNGGYVILDDNGSQVGYDVLGWNADWSSIHRIGELSDGSMAFAGTRNYSQLDLPIFRFGSLDFSAYGIGVPPYYAYPTNGPNGPAHMALALADGTAIIQGGFSEYAGTPCNGMARVFNNGAFVSPFGMNIPEPLTQLLPLPSGKFIGIGVNTYRLIRLNADGSWDASFPPGTGADGDVNAIAVQSDDKIILGGSFQAYNSTATKMARVDPAGDLETSFATSLPANSSIFSLAQQSDGKVLIAGESAPLARFNTDGTVDAGFLVPQTDGSAKVLAVQPDGKILIGGDFTQVDFNTRVRIARLNADGSVHSSFDPGGGADATVRAIVPLPGGKALIAGDFTSYDGASAGHIAQLNADGSLDASFNIGTGADGTIRSIVRQYDGRVVVAGDFYLFNGTYCPNIARLNADGSLDPTFSSGLGADGSIRCMVMQADGFILIGGDFTTYDGTSRNHIARLNNNGSLDPGFDPGTGASASVHALALQQDGMLLIGGAFTSYNGTGRNRIARVNNNVGAALWEGRSLTLEAYPNPTTRSIILQLPISVRPHGISVFTSTGSLVHTHSIMQNTGTVSLDLRDQPSGIYFVQLQMADGTVYSTPVMKE